LQPPARRLEWDDVIEFSFLAEFDLLRDSSGAIQERPWANPLGRQWLDRHFKILRAHEERERLNVEITRVIAHIYDECDVYSVATSQAESREPPDYLLSSALVQDFNERARFFLGHLKQLEKTALLPSFTGSLSRRTHISSLDPQGGNFTAHPLSSSRGLWTGFQTPSFTETIATQKGSPADADPAEDSGDEELEERVADEIITVLETVEDH
jgi:hypothetical protein